MAAPIRDFKVSLGIFFILIWISCNFVTARVASGGYDSSEEINPCCNGGFESRKTNYILKRQAGDGGDYYQDLNEVQVSEPTEFPGQIEPANYHFEYKIHGGGNYLGHAESRREEQTMGSYHALMPDGRMQIVSYYADDSGYHPTITYQDQNSNLPPPTDATTARVELGVQGDSPITLHPKFKGKKLRKIYTRVVKRIRRRFN